MGRPDASGGSHATATICTICSAVKVAGAPRRSLSVKTSSIVVVSALSLSPAISACSSLGEKASQRWHHALRTGLTACDLLQAGPLSCRECDLGGDRDSR